MAYKIAGIGTFVLMVIMLVMMLIYFALLDGVGMALVFVLWVGVCVLGGLVESERDTGCEASRW